MAEKFSPHTPGLNALIKAAQADWRAWLGRLVSGAADLVARIFLPQKATDEGFRSALVTYLEQQEQELLVRFTGYVRTPRERKEALQNPRIKRQWLEGESLMDMAIRTGSKQPGTTIPPFRPEPEEESASGLRARVVEVARLTKDDPVTDEERSATDYIRQRGFIFMRRPIQYATSEVERVLNDDELGKLREALAGGLTARDGHSRIKNLLEEACQGNPTLVNDMDRVVRTELAYAHHQVAMDALAKQAKEAGLGDDPMVFVLASPDACADCRRIWGAREKPNLYKLSAVRTGSNFRVPRKDWGPALPVHPQCLCPSPVLFSPKIKTAIDKVVEQMREKYGPNA